MSAAHELHVLFKGLPGARTHSRPLPDVLAREAQALGELHRAGAEAALELLRFTQRALPSWRQGQASEAPVDAELRLEEAQRAIARWHGFAEWSDVQARAGVLVDPAFEAAADAIVEGDAAALRRRIEAAPGLVRARSPFAHRATLLHHVAANGIEIHRQWQSPANALEIAELLLAAGAEPDATCDSYGPSDTPLGLLVTSAHPAAAGVQADLVTALCRAGAKPDGLLGDGAPLWAAVTLCYADAAARLARSGARVDNVILAAAVGDLDALSRYFDAEGRLLPEAARGLSHLGPGGPALVPAHVVEYALIYAAGHGRRAAVEFLLARGPDASVREPLWDDTALDKARYHGRSEIVALLEGRR